MESIAATVCLVSILLPGPAQLRMPWTFPGDFRDCLRISDLIVSGTIEDTSAIGVQTVDHIKPVENVARVGVDRVFQGSAGGEVQFAWYRLYVPPTGGGFVASLSPPANFRPHERYLIFLKQRTTGWVVAMPLYAIEFRLAPTPPSGGMRDLSQATAEKRYKALAQELETAALLIPAPQPGLTGEALPISPQSLIYLVDVRSRFTVDFHLRPAPILVVPRSTGYNLSSQVS